MTTTKFTIPPLVPSAEKRLGPVSFLSQEVYREGCLAGIDAIIALLREPDDGLCNAISWPPDLHTLADELERRKP